MSKDTVVIGASPNPERYSYKASISLKNHGHKVYPVGLRQGKIDGLDIITSRPEIKNVDTVTMYVGPLHIDVWINYVLSLHPKRIIFNPGAESDHLTDMAKAKGIECINACTLVMLSIGNY
jgi:uncharacterized protein